ncbi:class II fructose-bisphosphate aldolase [Candidatus Bathyarchaeota archaeon]|nr:class II fructose-bisphosphate aldolase [Candidatus Bathyarchaeota archaeon]
MLPPTSPLAGDPPLSTSSNVNPLKRPGVGRGQRGTCGGYAVLATACYNVEGIIALVRAAEAKTSPVIINLLPQAIKFADGLLVHAAREAADKACRWSCTWTTPSPPRSSGGPRRSAGLTRSWWI